MDKLVKTARRTLMYVLQTPVYLIWVVSCILFTVWIHVRFWITKEEMRINWKLFSTKLSYDKWTPKEYR